MALALQLGAMGIGLGFAALRWFTTKTAAIEGAVSTTPPSSPTDAASLVEMEMEQPSSSTPLGPVEVPTPLGPVEVPPVEDAESAWSRGPPAITEDGSESKEN